MSDRPAQPAPVVVALVRTFPRVTPANRNDRYHERINGFPPGPPIRERHPLPVLDPDVAVELRRATIGPVR